MVSTSRTTATGLSAALDGAISHDQITRFLSSDAYTPKDLWKQVKPVIRKIESEDGVTAFDDTIQEKPYMKETELFCYHFDHSKGRSVKGVNTLSCLYNVPMGDSFLNVPISYEHITKPIEYCDLKTKQHKRKSIKNKNEIFRSLFDQLLQNGIKFKYTLADIWFGSKDNMNHVRNNKKHFIFGAKSNRKIALSLKSKKQGRYVRIDSLDMQSDTVKKVYLEGVHFPLILFKKIFINGDNSTGIMYLFSSDTNLDADTLYKIYQRRWSIEEYHKSLKSNASFGASSARTVKTQSNHLFCSLYAYFKFEMLKLRHNLNHFALKSKIYIQAIKSALAQLQALKSLPA